MRLRRLSSWICAVCDNFFFILCLLHKVESPILEGKFFVLLASAIVDVVATVDELLENVAVFFADCVDEVAVGMGDVHVPRPATVPVEEIHSIVELRLR